MPAWDDYWHNYWNTTPQVHLQDALRQVGKTVNGVPVSAVQVEALLADLIARLPLETEDRLLDLCCGNGVITSRLATACRSVTGVDFSAPLLAVARERYQPDGVDYVLADICALPPGILQRRYTRVCMLEGLQHLSGRQADALLRQFNGPGRPGFLFAAVPDAARMDNFYDTPERRAEYERRCREGTEPIGHWWTRDELAALARAHGYEATFLLPSSGVPGAHYRVDVRFTPVPG